MEIQKFNEEYEKGYAPRITDTLSVEPNGSIKYVEYKENGEIELEKIIEPGSEEWYQYYDQLDDEMKQIADERIDKEFGGVGEVKKFNQFELINEQVEYFDDMSLEEKVNHLNQRLRNLESRI